MEGNEYDANGSGTTSSSNNTTGTDNSLAIVSQSIADSKYCRTAFNARENFCSDATQVPFAKKSNNRLKKHQTRDQSGVNRSVGLGGAGTELSANAGGRTA